MVQHLTWVADLAVKNGGAFGAEDECRFAGVLHDLGKYGTRFQGRLKGTESHIDHWSAGAFEAVRTGPTGVAAALAIQGHHIGLQRGDGDSVRDILNISGLLKYHPLGKKLSDDDHQAIKSRAQAEGFSWKAPAASCFDWGLRDADPVGQMLAVRMLFSALVDADFIATERHFEGASSRERRETVALDALAAHASLLSYISQLAERSTSATEANAVRRSLLETCLQAGGGPRGLFTLNAPTGSGKTLAMLAWALEHCLANPHLSRIIVVLPYLSIMEQTARVYREGLAAWLPEELRSRAILEHHSLASWKSVRSGPEIDDEQDLKGGQPRFLAENWDAPIVVTSTVQFFESLFANSPSACRKLHRIANSVILLDEVQTLSPSLIVPTLGALSTLVSRFRCSAVLATATQPAFFHLSPQVATLAIAGYTAQPIVADPAALFSRMRRTRVHWPGKGETTTWEDVASRMVDAEPRQGLCIVNLKRHAQALFELLREHLDDGILHLSSAMCPDHREAVLREVNGRLDGKKPCLLVATQCVEAGVDLDFPMVLRAFAPLDSIAQAAGRCNRNSNREYGDVWVFDPEESGRRYPDKTYEQAANVTLELLARRGGALDIDDPAVFTEYFRSLYDLSDPERNPELLDAIRSLDFLKVAELYRIIDQGSISIVSPWDVGRFTKLAAEVRNGRLTRSWIQRARGLTVNAFRPAPGATEWTHLEPIRVALNKDAIDWFLLKDPTNYDDFVGLRFQKGLAFTEG